MVPAKKKAAKKKTVKKKVAIKKTAAKKKVVKKAAPAAPKKIKAIKEPFTKTQLITTLAEQTELSKKEIKSVLESLGEIIAGHVHKNGAKTFSLPGLLKVKVNRKPATKARKGINPFSGEEVMFKAKPARNVVKILPLKALKDMAS